MDDQARAVAVAAQAEEVCVKKTVVQMGIDLGKKELVAQTVDVALAEHRSSSVQEVAFEWYFGCAKSR